MLLGGRCRSTVAATRAAGWPGPKGNLYIATGDNNSSGSAAVTRATTRSPTSRACPSPTRAPHRRQHQQPQRQDPAHPPGAGRDVHAPEGTSSPARRSPRAAVKTRGEIYVMGVRNPARISVDKKTDTLYAGWVGPDAGSPSPTWVRRSTTRSPRLPRRATGDGRTAWATSSRTDRTAGPVEAAGWYDCDAPKNESPNNDGLVNLPPVTGNNIRYRRRAADPISRATRTGSRRTSRRRPPSCRPGSRAVARPR
ncbi:hypothetical protein LV779_27990 [Streptomyces thinghirensis]|nr:hypothetical protein [Streptomyces thinghirensis]